MNNSPTSDRLVPEPRLLVSAEWKDYELVDSGEGRKLERCGPYTLIRPEHRAVWHPTLLPKAWSSAHAEFIPGGGESGGRWQLYKPVEPAWVMQYKHLKYYAQAAQSRQLGFFPEQASLWDWIAQRINTAGRPVRLLNLFAYTGLASLAACLAGAQVTHVEASRKAIRQAKENQALSNLEDKPIRWIEEDVLKYVGREIRRGSVYDAILLDPPKFGRGPNGEVWEFFKALPYLLEQCRKLLSSDPAFILVTAYGVQMSSISILNGLAEITHSLGGELACGELAVLERSSGRRLATSIYSSWQSSG